MRRGGEWRGRERPRCRMFATVLGTWICPEILQYNLRLIGVSIRRVIVTQLEQLIRSFPTIFLLQQKLIQWRGVWRETNTRSAVSTAVEGTMDKPSPVLPISSSNSCHFTHLFIFNYSAVSSAIRETANYHCVIFWFSRAQLFVLLLQSEQKFSRGETESIFFLAKYKSFN